MKLSSLRLWNTAFLFGVLMTYVRGAPPPDWVKPFLSEDRAWAHQAGAVYLLRAQEIRYLTSDRVQRQMRMVMRVGTEDARSRAILRYGYNPNTEKVTAARAWLISPDGKKTQVCANKDFVDSVAQYNNFFWSEERILRYNAAEKVEIGGVFAWEIQCESQTGIFDVNYDFIGVEPAVHCAFEVIPSAGGKLVWFATSNQVSAPIGGQTPGSLRWEMNDVRVSLTAFPDGFLPNPLRVSVRQVELNAPDTAPSWETLGRQMADIIEPRIEISPELRTKAEALVANKTARWDRVRALTEFVQKEVSYLSVTQDKDCVAGYRPHPAGEVLQNRYGDCKDKASLLCAMLRAVGDRGYVVLLYAKNPRAVIADWPSATFNHAIVAIPGDGAVPTSWPTIEGGALGTIVLFDATDPVTPLGALPEGDQGGIGLLISRETPMLVKLSSEAVSSAGLDRRVKATLQFSGHLHAEIDETYGGASGAQLARGMDQARKEGFTRSLESRLHRANSSSHQLHWREEWNPLKAHEHLVFDFEVDRFGRAVGPDRLMFCPVLFAEQPTLRPWLTSQEGAVWLPAQRVEDETRFVLPEGFRVEETPDDLAQEANELAWRVNYKVEGAEVTCRFEVSRPAGFVAKPKYEAYRATIQKFQEALKRPVVIQRTPVPL